MTHPLFEAREFSGGKFEGLDESVQVATLVAKIHAESNGVIDNEESNRDRDRKGTGADTLVVADRSEKGDSESRMGAWHVAVSRDVFELPAVLHAVHDKLRDLCDDTHDDWDEENSVLLEELVGYHTASISPRRAIRRETSGFSTPEILL